MSKVNSIQIKCEHCKKWFNSSIFLGDSQTFDTSTLEGNKEQCPHCKKMTGCNKDNMRMREDDGGFVGHKT